LRLSPARRFLYSTSVVRNNRTAQDLVQETFVAAFRNRHPFLAQSILSGFSASGATDVQRVRIPLNYSQDNSQCQLSRDIAGMDREWGQLHKFVTWICASTQALSESFFRMEECGAYGKTVLRVTG
jgi:hypothetical protein